MLKNLPELLGQNFVGTEFWLSNPPCYEETFGNNFVKLFITSPVRTQVNIEVPGKGFFRSLMTTANDVVAIDLDPSIGQPLKKIQEIRPYLKKYIKDTVYI